MGDETQPEIDPEALDTDVSDVEDDVAPAGVREEPGEVPDDDGCFAADQLQQLLDEDAD